MQACIEDLEGGVCFSDSDDEQEENESHAATSRPLYQQSRTPRFQSRFQDAPEGLPTKERMVVREWGGFLIHILYVCSLKGTNC